MAQWSIPLQSVFPQAVGMICSSPVLEMKHSLIYHDLSKSQFPTRYPEATAELLLHLLRTASILFYDTGEVVDIVKQLAATDVDRQRLIQICDVLARKGYHGAKALKDLVDGGAEKQN